MATSAASVRQRHMAPRARRFTVQEYYAMAEAGILGREDRTELIEGQILAMSPIGSRHAVCVDTITELLFEQVRRRARIRVQGPIRLADRSEPEPDVALLRPGDYTKAHPGPADVLLVVEVADSTLPFDRRVKVPLYARHGVPEVWIVALDEGKVYVHRTPTPDGYAAAHAVEAGGTLTVEALPDVQLAAQDMLV